MMETNSNTILVDNYFALLQGLSRENRIKLIAKLSNSIVEETSEKLDVIDRFFGAFKSNKSADEIIEEIRGSRIFNRKIENL